MSLVGSLEDLGLGDILQIVSLSRKSGLLLLRSDSGEGRIVLCDGMVRGASIKGGFEDLRGLLVGGGFLSGDDFDRARASAEERDVELGAVLPELSVLTEERLESLRREHVERSVMRMFSWRTGEFSFEVKDAVDPQDTELLLPTGINTQYLAMQAIRLRDESSRDLESDDAIGDPVGETDDEPLFSGEESEGADFGDEARHAAPTAVDALALAAARRSDDAVVAAVGGDQVPEIEASTVDGVEKIAVAGRAAQPEQVRVDVAASGSRPPSRHLVVMDPDLAGLEWLKATLEGRLERIHIFQRSELAVDRIKYYLGRGVLPLLIVSARLPIHSSTGAADAAGLVARLRALAPRMRIAALCEEGRTETLDGVDALLQRPACPGSDPELWSTFDETAERLREGFESFASGAPRIAAQAPVSGPPSLSRLEDVSERLRDPSTQGEVLSLVLAFASEILSRVAIFMLREEVAVGMAQVGLARAGGPGDAGLQQIELSRDALPELFTRVLAAGRAQRAPLAGANDHALADRLGDELPAEAYGAPIESGGCVVALLYGDNLPAGGAIGDTTALEIVLHEAGLALDRALRERALADGES